ncbi:hypothetical protein JJJ17_02610 [Paracoccus caeni]|uniref:Uncharacterized protein n=1 Tax=Paracoccus caeni TaxID=657651 RepID=A0A934SBC5_9RHOB|nr:hypothetical protein [Paracoccus caeni]MBK4214812.1 hypothetical protein [Paracoccus caeni]
MFDLQTELHLRQQEQDHRLDSRADTLLRWGLVLSNLTVLALVAAQLL